MHYEELFNFPKKFLKDGAHASSLVPEGADIHPMKGAAERHQVFTW